MNLLFQIEKLKKNYSKEYGFNLTVIDNISFDIFEKEICFLIAPKYSGKTTLLKVISGLELQTGGKIIPVKQNIKTAFIPTQPSSLPWLNVKENISEPLKYLGFDKEQIERKVIEAISLVELDGYEEHFPDNESYGFRLRISIARAIAAGAHLITLDEPFIRLNSKVKNEILELLSRLKNDFSFFITSSFLNDEILIADRVLKANSFLNDKMITISKDGIKDLENFFNKINEPQK